MKLDERLADFRAFAAQEPDAVLDIEPRFYGVCYQWDLDVDAETLRCRWRTYHVDDDHLGDIPRRFMLGTHGDLEELDPAHKPLALERGVLDWIDALGDKGGHTTAEGLWLPSMLWQVPARFHPWFIERTQAAIAASQASEFLLDGWEDLRRLQGMIGSLPPDIRNDPGFVTILQRTIAPGSLHPSSLWWHQDREIVATILDEVRAARTRPGS